MKLIAAILALAIFGGGGDSGREGALLGRVGGVVRMSGKAHRAHGCPIAPYKLLTNAHVIEHTPGERGTPFDLYRYESVDGRSKGYTISTQPWVSEMVDLALVPTSGHLARTYPIASTCPKVGDKVLILGYQQKEGSIIAPWPRESEVKSIFAGTVEYDDSGFGGSSGSCILNDRDEVVGINTWTYTEGTTQNGAGVAICGEWMPEELKEELTIVPDKP